MSKGDRNRSDSKAYRDNFDNIEWKPTAYEFWTALPHDPPKLTDDELVKKMNEVWKKCLK